MDTKKRESVYCLLVTNPQGNINVEKLVNLLDLMYNYALNICYLKYYYILIKIQFLIIQIPIDISYIAN